MITFSNMWQMSLMQSVLCFMFYEVIDERHTTFIIYVQIM